MIERAGSEARLGFKAHPHMLRHACGYALANKGHDTRALQAYLGIAISSTRCATRNCLRHGFGISGDEIEGKLSGYFGSHMSFLSCHGVIR